MAEKATILVVDDSEDLLNLMAVTLGREHIVRKASDGGGALHAAFEEPKPDLILLDVEMPDVSGFQLCSTLKAAPQVSDIPVIFLTGNADPKSVIEGFKLGAIDYIVKPVSPPVLAVRVRTHLELIRFRAKQEEMLAERTVQLERTRLELIRRLGRAMEYHETSAVGNRVVRLGHYARALAQAAGARPAMCDLIMKAAPLHDIGKVGVPAAVLRKSSALTAPEREQMQRHPEIGAEIIGEHDDALLKLARTLALTHHERWDGNGYPAGARGADIPWAGRLMAIVDSFESMTATQFHREPRPIDLAADEIFRGGGKQFDPQLIDAFREALPEFRRIHSTYGDQLGDLLNLDFSAAADAAQAPATPQEAEVEARAAEGMRDADDERAAALAGAQARLAVERELAAAATSDIVTRKDAVKKAEDRAAREATLLAAAKLRIAEENDAALVAREQEGVEARAEALAREARVTELNVIAAAMEREKAAEALEAAKDRRKVSEQELAKVKAERAAAEARAAEAESRAQEAMRDAQRAKEHDEAVSAQRELHEKATRLAEDQAAAATRAAELARKTEAEAQVAQAAAEKRLVAEQARADAEAQKLAAAEAAARQAKAAAEAEEKAAALARQAQESAAKASAATQEQARADEALARAMQEKAAADTQAAQFQRKVEAEAREAKAAAEKRLAAEQARGAAEAERLAAEEAAAREAKSASEAEAKVAELARAADATAAKAAAAAEAKARAEEALAKAAAEKRRAKEAVASSGARRAAAEVSIEALRTARSTDEAAAAAITIASAKRRRSSAFGILLGLLLGLTAAAGGIYYFMQEIEPTLNVVHINPTPAVQRPIEPKPVLAEGEPIALRFDPAFEKIPPR